MTELSAKRAAAGNAEVLDTTNVIESAVRETFTEQRLINEALVEWRRMSGVAHGWTWAALGQPSTTNDRVRG